MKLMAIDGNSILNRAYYGIARPMTNAAGMRTNAIYGFISMMRGYINADSPDAVCVAFDMKGPTHRKLLFDGYKANRKGMPDELAVQLPFLKRTLNLMGIPYYESSGWEADDILGTISKQCQGTECVLVSGDRDILQLIRSGVGVRLAGSKSALYDGQRFVEEYGFMPENLVDYKALAGDSSDNIPGVKGIGDKSARALISKYKSLDGVYDNIDSLIPSVQKKLLENKENARLSFELAKINCNAPITLELPDSLYSIDNNGLYELFTELGFAQFVLQYGLKAD